METQKAHRNPLIMLLIAVIGMVFSPISVRAQDEGVTAKEIQTFGEELQGEKVKMTATLHELDDQWVRLKLKDDRFVGFFVHDSNNHPPTNHQTKIETVRCNFSRPDCQS